LTIDELARHTHTTVRNIRAFQERGLLASPRLVARTAYYDQSHADRLHIIHRLQKEGFSLAAIRTLFDAWDNGISLSEVLGLGNALDAATSAKSDATSFFPVTKFQRPISRPEHITRVRCLDELSKSATSHVLLTAPGGSGKSILAAQLLSLHDGPNAWLSCEAADDDPRRFWTAVLIAIRSAVTDFGAEMLDDLVTGRPVDSTLVALADRLNSLTSPVWLAIDDFHSIANTEIARHLEWLVGHVNARRWRLVLCSRTAPTVAINRHIIQGDLIHLQPEQISFDPEEAGQFLVDRLGASLNQSEVHDIAAGTDGWPAGVYVAGLRLKMGMPPAEVIASLTNPDHTIQQYFDDEILKAVHPEVISFLEDISCLPRFTAELCDAVRQRTDSQQFLDQLSTNMFVLRLDVVGCWHRLHHTLSTAMQARTHATDPAGVAARHRRAADWYHAQERFREALDHYLEGGAYQEAAGTIKHIFSDNEATERSLRLIPADFITGSTDLALASVVAAGQRGDRYEMTRWLALAETLAGTDAEMQRKVAIARGLFHFGEIETGLDWLESAYRSDHSDDMWFVFQASISALLSLWVRGPSQQARDVVETAMTRPVVKRDAMLELGLCALRAVVLADQKDPVAQVVLDHVAELRAKHGSDIASQAPAQSAIRWCLTAWANRLLGNYDAAQADCLAAYELIVDLHPDQDAAGAVVPVLIEVAHAEISQGRMAQARRHIEEGRRRLQRIAGPGRLPQMLAEAAKGLTD
jgi:ATP/maltotriose-dependent transcriptional regulator MalT